LQRMDAWSRDPDAELAVREHRHRAAPQAPAHLSRYLPGRPPRPHLLRGRRGGALGRAATPPQSPHRVGPPAARRQSANRILEKFPVFQLPVSRRSLPRPSELGTGNWELRIDEYDVKVISL